MKVTGKQVEEQLQQWAGRSAEYFKAKTNDVKELLIALASTAESMGKQDQRYAKRLGDFTTQLQTIADLDDLAQMRATLVKRAAELKSCVDEMAQDSNKSLAQLRAEVASYETKLKTVEQLAFKDPLTGLANRRSVEERIEWHLDLTKVLRGRSGPEQIQTCERHNEPRANEELKISGPATSSAVGAAMSSSWSWTAIFPERAPRSSA